ncbi:unnamed protein product, partial [Rotaria magnacalcarata]
LLIIYKCFKRSVPHQYKNHAMVVSLVESETIDYKSSSQIQTTSREPFNPHTTKWSDVNLVKFGAFITVASTIENAVFYP